MTNEAELYYILAAPGTNDYWKSSEATSSLVRKSLAKAFHKVSETGYHGLYKLHSDDPWQQTLDHTCYETEKFPKLGFERTPWWVRTEFKHTLITWSSKELNYRARCTLFNLETNEQLQTVELRRDQSEDQLEELVKKFRRLIEIEAPKE